MSTLTTLLESRRRMKRRKPSFTRQDQHKKNEIKRNGWRRPKGVHSKMREHRRGYKIGISIGWKSPAAVRGLDRNGLRPILVHNPDDLARIDPKTQGALIGSGVGGRKRLAILNAAKGKINILNAKNIEASITKITGALAQRKKDSKERLERKSKTTKQAAKTLDKKVEEAPKSPEEIKKEQDKILTQREV